MISGFTDVDIEAVCRRVLREPRRARLSTIEQVAVCGRLMELFNNALVSAVNPDLVLAIGNFVAAQEAYAEIFADRFERSGLDRLEAEIRRDEAFNTLKTTFETEVKNGKP